MLKNGQSLPLGGFKGLKNFLDQKVQQYNQPSFVAPDPVCIPHLFTLKQDIEISGFIAAVLAWGQRKTIINKCKELFIRMDNAPYDFVLHHNDEDLKKLLNFKHRTFNDTDLLYFIAFFKHHYQNFNSLEKAFIPFQDIINPDYLQVETFNETINLSSPVCYQNSFNFSIEESLNHFRAYFFSLEDFPNRTKKHVSSPMQKSTCKRLNMFLRWMVRKDNNGVDFGIWNTLHQKDLICPCDVHVDRVGRALGLITRKQTDWLTAVELTTNLKKFDATDPVKYDFALFGLGVEKVF
ncbi:TIGR02757 family protein [Pedobacter changchengzhani]|uniref:TIGR02757 family protein n=1 Tax=Pedobacter changchengzhani TaxID=2529274 RepID=A0A4R5MMY8_9SPHI|nr:TIGR02757 family protein [Pedobacter changchengzhani]TDG36896.1 TIGR02757 family protein [Pedobacter changchengzhani]